MTPSPAHLSQRAIERTAERFGISSDKLVSLMNAGHGKRIGVSTATNITHRLLWSPDDNAFLVVLQEVVSGTVLSVLGLDAYKKEYAENLSESRAQGVINQMVYAGHAPSFMWKPGSKDESVTVHAHIIDMPQPTSLGRWKGDISSPDLWRLGEDANFWDWVLQRLGEKQLEVDGLTHIEARFKGGENRVVPYLVCADLTSTESA